KKVKPRKKLKFLFSILPSHPLNVCVDATCCYQFLEFLEILWFTFTRNSEFVPKFYAAQCLDEQVEPFLWMNPRKKSNLKCFGIRRLYVIRLGTFHLFGRRDLSM